MKCFTLPIVLIMCTCCNNPQKQAQHKLESDLRTYLTAIYKEADSANVIDSVQLIRLDTITQADRLFLKSRKLTDSIQYYIDKLKQSNQDLSHAKSMLRLSTYSETLYDHYKDEFTKHLNEGKELSDRASELLHLKDSLNKIAANADSIIPVDFEAKCFYKLKRKDASIKRDTAYVFVSNNMEIIRKEDYYSSLLEFK